METKVRLLVSQLKKEKTLKSIGKILNVEFDIEHNFGVYSTRFAIITDSVENLLSNINPEPVHVMDVSEIITKNLNAESMTDLLEVLKTSSEGLIDASINLIGFANCKLESLDSDKEEALVSEAAMSIMILNLEYNVPIEAFNGFA